MLRTTIVNRSDWPDNFLSVVCPWIAKQAGIRWHYEFLLRSTPSRGWWRGRGWSHKQTVNCSRRVFPTHHEIRHKDSRYKYSPRYVWYGPIETLVHVLAHECYHATGGNREKFRKPNGHIDRETMELKCNKFAQQTLLKFRKEWPKLRKQLRSSHDQVKRCT